jgi:hypothetical protein
VTDRDFDPVIEAFRRSVPARLLNAAAGRLRADWRSASLVNACRATAAAVTAHTREQQVRLAAIAVVVAAIVHLGLRLSLPRYAMSGLPWWWNAVIAAAAAGVAAASRDIVSGWPESAPARLWRKAAR